MGEKRICIRDLNPHIVCILCAGYFIDATTITECLHTFCKSCVVKYLQTSKHCPMCNVKIHDTQPLLNLKPDRVMQEIVYKLVPNLMENEEVRKAEFEKTRGMNHSLKSDVQILYHEPDETSVKEYNSNFNMVLDGMHSYLYDEQISLCLEPVSLCTKEGTDGTSYYGCVKRKYVRCSVRTQISHIKRLIPRLWPCYEGELIEVLCQDEELDDCCCLKYTWLTKWVNKVTPMTLRFRSKYPETPSYALNLVTLQELSDRSNQH